MQIKQEKLEKNRLLLEITVDANEVEEFLTRAYRKVVQKVNIPGFRRGKAPREIIEARFGKEVLYNDALEMMVNETYQKAIEEHNIQPIDHPEIESTDKFQSGQQFTYKATVEVLPPVELGDYKNIKIKKEKAEVSDKDFEEQVNLLRMRHAEIVLAKKDKLEKGDFAVIDFEGFIDNKPFAGGAAEGYLLEIGSHTFIPGFEEQLIGLKPGESKEIKVVMPDDAEQYKDLAGKEVTFKVKLHEIKQRKLPELDDDFAKDISEFSSWDEYKEDLRQRMLKVAEKEAEKKYAQAVIAKVVEQSKVDIPSKLVDRQVEMLLKDFAQNLAYQGVKIEDYLAYKKTDIDTIKKELLPKAEMDVKADLVLAEIAKKEKIEVSEDDLKNKIEELAALYHQTPQELEKTLQKNRRSNLIKDQIMMEKTTQFLVENSQQA